MPILSHMHWRLVVGIYVHIQSLVTLVWYRFSLTNPIHRVTSCKMPVVAIGWKTRCLCWILLWESSSEGIPRSSAIWCCENSSGQLFWREVTLRVIIGTWWLEKDCISSQQPAGINIKLCQYRWPRSGALSGSSKPDCWILVSVGDDCPGDGLVSNTLGRSWDSWGLLCSRSH